ncbi:MAG: hypothetical protein AAF502_09540 [Bacteroidota bacterium]
MKVLNLISCLFFCCFANAQSFDLLEGKTLGQFDINIDGEGETVDGEKEGSWTFFQITDKKLKYAEGKYKNGQKQGEWKTYRFDRYNSLKTKEIFRNDSLVSMIYLMESGRKSFEIEPDEPIKPEVAIELEKLNFYFTQVILEGIINYSMSPEQTRDEYLLIYRDLLSANKVKTVMNVYHRDGYLIETKNISNNNVTKTIYKYAFRELEKTINYVNGKLEYEKRIIDGNKDNFKLLFYFENGKLKMIQEFKDSNVKNGKWEAYHSSGKKKFICYYKDGKLDGTLKEWDEQGNLMKKEVWKNGTKSN